MFSFTLKNRLVVIVSFLQVHHQKNKMNLVTILGTILVVFICQSEQKTLLPKDNSSSESVLSNSTSSEIADKDSPTTTDLFSLEEAGKQFHESSDKLTKDTSSEENSSEEKSDPKYLNDKEEQCRGLGSIQYLALNQVCEDCYSLHNEPEIYTICR